MFLGVVLVSFLWFVLGLVCVFLFVFVYGYVVSGLVMVWCCVGNCFVFVKLFHYVRLACFVCLVVVLSRALLLMVFCVCQVCSYCEMVLTKWVCLGLSIAFRVLDLVCVFGLFVL